MQKLVGSCLLDAGHSRLVYGGEDVLSQCQIRMAGTIGNDGKLEGKRLYW